MIITEHYMKAFPNTYPSPPPLLHLSAGSTPGNFDMIVHNANVLQAYTELRNYVIGEIERQRDAGVDCTLTRNANFKLQ